MKVNYPVASDASLKVIKELLKPYGGRCAKIADGSLEYQIAEENKDQAYHQLKEKGIVS